MQNTADFSRIFVLCVVKKSLLSDRDRKSDCVELFINEVFKS